MKFIKSSVVLFSTLLLTTNITVAQAFITTWKTDNHGVSNSKQITIPTSNFVSEYNYTVEWESISNPLINNLEGPFFGDATITFPEGGTYLISITGTFPQIFFDNGGDKQKILSIEQWGDIQWESMESSFEGCSEMVLNATDAPDLSNATSLSSLFQNASLINSDLNNWDVITIQEMDGAFAFATSFDGDLSNWNTENVTTMRYMFNGAASFNGDISQWNVANVLDMTWMFGDADNFNTDIGDWDVSAVTEMHSMFYGASSFNQDLSFWNTSSVTTMSYMFSNAIAYNQAMNLWNASQVTDMSSMFTGAALFDQSLDNWNTGLVTDMSAMFRDAKSFNQDLDSWNTSNVIDMSFMFSGALAFNQDIGSWDVSKVESMAHMFGHAEAFNQFIGDWNVSQVKDMSHMFEISESFDQDISGWNVSNVTDMEWMFFGVDSFNQDIGSWDVSSVKTMEGMFYFSKSFDQDISNWDVEAVTDMFTMFSNTNSFNQDLSKWNVSNVSNMQSMFRSAENFNQDLSTWSFSSLDNGSHMFSSSAFSTFNYDNLLKSLKSQSLKSGVALGASQIKYSLGAQAARNVLTEDFGWIITDDGPTESPVFENERKPTIEENTTLGVDVTANDGNGGVGDDNVSYSLKDGVDKELFVIDEETGLLSFMEAPNFEKPIDSNKNNLYAVVVKATDTDQNVSEQLVVIEIIDINDAPFINQVADITVNENEMLSFLISGSDEDLPQQELTYSVTESTFLPGMILDSQSGEFKWTPNESNDGIYEVIISLTDGELVTDESFMLSVNEVNELPVISLIEDLNTKEELEVNVSVSASDIDIPSQSLTYSLDDNSLAKGMVIDAMGVFKWVPREEHDGLHQVIVKVGDGLGETTTAFAVFVDEVLGINDKGVIKVFPNPATDFLNVARTDFEHGQYAILLLSPIGQVLHSLVWDTNKDILIPIRDLSAGVYFMEIRNSETSLMKTKIIIER